MSMKRLRLPLEQLNGKKVCYARAGEKCLILEFEGDYKLVVEEKSSDPRLDSSQQHCVGVKILGPGGWLVVAWDMEA